MRKLQLIVEKTWVALISGDQKFKNMEEVREMFKKFPSLDEPPVS